MSCRFVHFSGRPAFLPVGSSGSNTAHCASVRSNRPATATLATRSPVFRFAWSLTHLPETSPSIDYRHADEQLTAHRLTKHALVSCPAAGGVEAGTLDACDGRDVPLFASPACDVILRIVGTDGTPSLSGARPPHSNE